MTENKRFTVHIKWFNYDKTEGEIELFDNGQPLLVSEDVEDVQYIKTLLNELAEENMMLRGKHTRLIILLKDIVNDLKRMDTKGYAEHIEKIENIKFLGMEDLE